jgi:hypothetical protein
VIFEDFIGFGAEHDCVAVKRDTNFIARILALGNVLEARYAADWWTDFAKMNRQEFESAARDLVGPEGRLTILRKVVAEVGAF